MMTQQYHDNHRNFSLRDIVASWTASTVLVMACLTLAQYID